VGSLAEIVSPTIALTAEYLNMQVELRPDSQRKQSTRRKRRVSTQKQPMKALPNGQVSLTKGRWTKGKSAFRPACQMWRN